MTERHKSAMGYHPWLHRFAVSTAGATLLLIVAGALVTSNQAGLAVPDWPLSYGTWMPPMVGGIFYEHGHRMIGASVGLLTIILALWLWRAERRSWLRRLGFIGVAAVVLQGVLGGITVLYLLPWPVSVGHASLAQLFFCLTVSLALFTSKGWQEEAPPLAEERVPSLPRLSIATALAVFVQLVLGATVRHHVLGIVPHLLGAALVVVLVAWTVRRVFLHHNQKALRQPVKALAILTALQLALGMGSYLARLATADAPQPQPLMVALTVAHVAAGALLLATSVVLALQTHRLFDQRSAVESRLFPATQRVHP
ncbi:MAG: COX15/CtaA family protein [Acidobacteria bacterium]|nr:COX15/CtaA family protein [Acidobacteriota bacterium]